MQKHVVSNAGGQRENWIWPLEEHSRLPAGSETKDLEWCPGRGAWVRRSFWSLGLIRPPALAPRPDLISGGSLWRETCEAGASHLSRIPSKSAESDTPSASLSAATFRRPTFRTPRSMPLT